LNLIFAGRLRNAPRESAVDGFGGAIISIGPQTDAALQHFGFSDRMIPRLRVLMQNSKSTAWKARLNSDEFGMTLEQAKNIARAMENDITGKPIVSNKSVGHFIIIIPYSVLIIPTDEIIVFIPLRPL
jgi:hypothetical protein